LPEADVPKPVFLERQECVGDLRDISKKARRLIDSHVQNVSDVFSFVGDLQCLAVVAAATADFARDIPIGEKMHLDLFHAVAFARFASTAFDIEAETTGVIPADPRAREARE